MSVTNFQDRVTQLLEAIAGGGGGGGGGDATAVNQTIQINRLVDVIDLLSDPLTGLQQLNVIAELQNLAGLLDPLLLSNQIQRANINAFVSANGFLSLVPATSGYALAIYAISLNLSAPITLALDVGTPITPQLIGTFVNLAVIEPPFSVPYVLVSDRPLRMQLSGVTGPLTVSGTIEYKLIGSSD
jgi:hypothetical protein